MRFALLLASLLLAPGAVALQAERAQVPEETVITGFGTMRATIAGEESLRITGTATVHVVDEHLTRFDPEAEGQLLPPVYDNYRADQQDFGVFNNPTFELQAAAGIVISSAAPLEGRLRGARIEQAPAQILESSHAVDETAGKATYYEYAVPAGLATQSDSATILTGASHLYVWGVDLTLPGGQTIRTGASTSTIAPGIYEIHYVYATVAIDGTSQLDTLPLALFAPRVTIDPDALHLESATGQVAVTGYRYAVADDTILEGGRYELAAGDETLDVTVLDPPHDVAGAHARIVYHELAWFWPSTTLAAILLIGLAAAHSRSRSGRHRRAAWALRLAHRARRNEVAGRRIRSACQVALLSALDAQNPLGLSLRARRMRPDQAVRALAKAYPRLSGPEQARAALEIARIEALNYNGGEAATWLARALAQDAGLLPAAVTDASFKHVYQDAQFRRCMARWLGWSADAPQA